MEFGRFIVFARADRHPWSMFPEASEGLSVAIKHADAAVSTGSFDRAVVMEIAGKDAMPLFIYRYGAKR